MRIEQTTKVPFGLQPRTEPLRQDEHEFRVVLSQKEMDQIRVELDRLRLPYRSSMLRHLAEKFHPDLVVSGESSMRD